MKIVALWHLRPDAPYKSRMWGMWVVEPEQANSIVERIRSVENWEETQLIEAGSAPEPIAYGAFGDPMDVVYVYDFQAGLLHSADSYGDYPGLFNE